MWPFNKKRKEDSVQINHYKIKQAKRTTYTNLQRLERAMEQVETEFTKSIKGLTNQEKKYIYDCGRYLRRFRHNITRIKHKVLH